MRVFWLPAILAAAALCGCGDSNSGSVDVPTAEEQAAWSAAHAEQVAWFEDWEKRYDAASAADDQAKMVELNKEYTQYVKDHPQE